MSDRAPWRPERLLPPPVKNPPVDHPSTVPPPRYGGRSRRVVKMIRELEHDGYTVLSGKDLARLERLMK